jgi:hypothetical protein
LVSHDEPISQRNAVPMRAGSTVSIMRANDDGRGGFRTCDLSRVKRALSH